MLRELEAARGVHARGRSSCRSLANGVRAWGTIYVAEDLREVPLGVAEDRVEATDGLLEDVDPALEDVEDALLDRALDPEVEDLDGVV